MLNNDVGELVREHSDAIYGLSGLNPALFATPSKAAENIKKYVEEHRNVLV